MKFYDREHEISFLRETAKQAETAARFTVITGRRRIGKTSLITHAYEGSPFLYFFVARQAESDLCENYVEEIQLENEKITLFKELKSEIEPSLKDSNITLDSFIISNTKYIEVEDWGTLKEFEDHNVLFQKDSEDYIDKLFTMIL